MTTTPATGPVETKVKAATWAAAAVGVLITVLNAVAADSSLLGALPAWLQGVVTVAAPPLVTFLAGWKARHTPRPQTPATGADGTL